MIFCFGTVSWGGYLERYVDIFVNNYSVLYRKLISLGINHADIVNPKIICCNEKLSPSIKNAIQKLKITTGKQLQLIHDKHDWDNDQIMYSTRNRLRNEFKKSYPLEKKVFFYFPIDDRIRPEATYELMKLRDAKTPTACMFKFYVNQGGNDFIAGTRPICSYKDIHASDWGGYCAYNILNEDECPLYPKISIPNVAFYIELYKAGYKEYESDSICIEHLRHLDSHHFKFKDTKMSQIVKNYLVAQKMNLCEKEGK